jgi:hypothetical protein
MKKFYIAANLKPHRNYFLSAIILLITGFVFTSSQTFAQHFRTQGGPFLPAEIAENNATLDALPPVITYTPLVSTCATGNRTLTATITDLDGVPTSGAGLPVLYWRINSGPWTSVTGASIGANQYNFTFGGTAIPGNIVSYYIVAQDNASTPNVIAKPSAGAGGYTASPPDAATPPTTPDFYVIQTTLTAGTYLVGAGQTYLTITDAINAYNNSCLSGPVVFALTDAAYGPSETFPILISNPAASSTNTLTIKPNTGVNATVTGSSTDALFKFNGADYITIDGSNSGGTTRNLTLINTSTGTSSAIIWMASFSASNGSTNNTIKNCNINGNAGTTTFAGIASSSGVLITATADAANSNNIYQNNSIHTCYHGMYINGPATGETGTVISTNLIGSTLAARKLGYRGIFAANQTNLTINNNTVTGINSVVGTGSEPDASGGIFISGNISGGNIYSNRINDIRNTNTSGAPSFGISLQSATNSTNLKIYNNFIYEVIGFGKSSSVLDNGHGIAVLNGGGYGIYFNSVHLFVNQNAVGITSSIYIGTSLGGSIDVRNNIFSNRQTSGTRYAIYCSLTSAAFNNINYNDYFSAGSLGYLSVPRANIGSWQTATGQDGNSVAANPIFVSNSDLHLQLISPLNDQGNGIGSITGDIDNDSRSATTPDIGADEFTPPPCAANLGGTASSSTTTICISGSVILSSTGFSFGVGISYQWESSTDNVLFTPIAGENNPTSANPPAINVTTYYRLRVTCSAGVPGYSNTLTITVNNPQILTTTPASRCGTGTLTLGATSNPGTTISWYAAASGGASLGTGTSYVTPSLSTTTTYYAEATYTGSNGTCGPVSPTSQGGTISTQLTSWEVYFNVLQATTLVSVDVFPLAIGEASTLEIYNSSNTVVAAIPYTTTVAGGATAQTIPINVSLPAGNGYYLYASAGIPPTGLTRNISGATYPYNSTDISIAGNGFDQTFFMCYYNWKFSNGCSSPRTAITASIISPPAITPTATPAAICAGSSTNLSVTSSNGAYVYTWTPGSLVGATHTVSPASTTTYTVNANDGSCVTSATVTVTVNFAPSAVTVTPATTTKCAGTAPQLLTASGGSLSAVVLSENFNGGGLPSGWQIPVAAGQLWTLRPNNYIYSNPGNGINVTFRSNDNSQFYLANSDAQASGATQTSLITPAFSLVGFTSATVSFWHHYSSFDGPESINVERSANGTSGWVSVYTATVPAVIGGTTSFVNISVPLTAYVGQATNYLRFRYLGRQDFWWAIDNVVISGSSGTTPITWAPTTGLFTNAGGTIPYTGTATTTVYANPTAEGTNTYTATATSPNSCTTTGTADVVIRPLVTGTLSGTTSGCPSANYSMSIALTGTGPWNLTYTDGTTPVTVNNIAASPYTFTVNPVATTTYSITALSDANCTALPAGYSTTATVTINPTVFSTWTGVTSDWNDVNNWCGGVPTSIKDVVIPSGPAVYPVITNGTPVARNITIDAGASLTIDAGGTLSLSGNTILNGTLTNNGTLVLNGTTAQTFPGGTTGTIAAMNILEVNKANGTASFDKEFVINGALKPTAGTIAVNDTITLRSNASGTASIDKVGATASFSYNATGRFTVERYIPTGVSHGKTWQLLSTPTFGQTVNQSWQEGASGPSSNPKPGYGTTITSNVPGAIAAGFDFATPAGSTMKYYNDATNAYDGIPNTLTYQLANAKGYMLFVRGDRSVTAFNQPATSTILRSTGKVYSPGADAPPSSIVAPNKFQSVGNPYASAIEFTNLLTTSTGLDTKFYVWDPLMPSANGFGAFQLISSVNGYKPWPGGTSNYDASVTYSKIQSGQAFFVYSVPGGTVNFTENNKVAGSQQVFRPGIGSRTKFLRVRLYSNDGNLVDGNILAFDPGFSNGFDANDARKLTNFGENFGISNNGYSLSLDARKFPSNGDTVFYTFNNLRATTYQLKFAPENIEFNGMNAYLVDKYTGLNSPVSLSDTTYINFTINADAGSRAQDRFFLVFRQMRVVPVIFTHIQAHLIDKQIAVNWQTENEINISHYEVEKSADGRNFTRLGILKANGNAGKFEKYGLNDEMPFSGNNYFRIKSIGSGTDIQYSKVVNVWVDNEQGSIVAYPNPVTEEYVNAKFTNLTTGMYKAQLYNPQGQIIYSKDLYHKGGNGVYRLYTASLLASGIYTLEYIMPSGKRKTEKLLVK